MIAAICVTVSLGKLHPLTTRVIGVVGHLGICSGLSGML
jgi:hypothetical protein